MQNGGNPSRVRKQRNGPVGTVNMVFLHAQTKFENRAEDTGEVE